MIFVAFDIADDATIDDSVGAKISAGTNDWITINPPERSIEEIEFESSLAKIYSKYKPVEVKINMPKPWLNSSGKLEFSWQGFSFGEISQVLYAIGTTPYGEDIVSYREIQPAGKTSLITNFSSGTINIEGLALNHGQTYYLSLKVKSSVSEEFSDPVSQKFQVDLSSPSAPVEIVVSQDGLLSWKPAEDPESGIFQYKIQRRDDASPIWNDIGNVSSTTLSYKDEEILPGHFYYYQIQAQNTAGEWGPFSSPVLLKTSGITSSELISQVSSYPNPFNPIREETTICFLLQTNASVDIKIFDLNGNKVWEIQTTGIMGLNNISWNGRNSSGNIVGNGGYICRISVNNGQKIVERKILVVK